MVRPSLRRSAALAILGLLVAACATRGRDFDVDRVPHLRPGTTTQQEVTTWFGEPLGVRVDAGHGVRWHYLYEEEVRKDTGILGRIARAVGAVFGQRVITSPVNVADVDRTRHDLRVWFDREGVVRDYSYERRDIPSTRVY